MIDNGKPWLARGGRRRTGSCSGFSDNTVPVQLGLRRKNRVRRKAVSIAFALVLSTLSALKSSQPSFAATPYEAQIGGFISASLHTLITGEFAGQSPSNADANLNRPVCRSADYDELRAAANDRRALDAFRRKCKFVETKIDQTHVHGIAYLPVGYCTIIKNAVDKEVLSRINEEPAHFVRGLTIEYKGAVFESTDRLLARRAGLEAKCQEDGSLRVSAPRKRP
jgi:hypothetical protein